MKIAPLLLLPLLLAARAAFAQTAPASATVPAPREIEAAYQATTGGGIGIGPVRIGNRRVREVRGWELKFKQLSQKGGSYAVTTKTRVIARKDGSCAEYLVTDTVLLSSPSPSLGPALYADQVAGLRACG